MNRVEVIMAAMVINFVMGFRVCIRPFLLLRFSM